MDQHRPSPLSQTKVRYSPETLEDLVLIEEPGFSTQMCSLLLPDGGVYGNSWNSSESPFLSMTQPHVNRFYPLTVSQVSLLFTKVYLYLDANATTGRRDSECGESSTWASPESLLNTSLVTRGTYNTHTTQNRITSV